MSFSKAVGPRDRKLLPRCHPALSIWVVTAKLRFLEREDGHKAGLARPLEDERKTRPQLPSFMSERVVRIPEKSRTLRSVL